MRAAAPGPPRRVGRVCARSACTRLRPPESRDGGEAAALDEAGRTCGPRGRVLGRHGVDHLAAEARRDDGGCEDGRDLRADPEAGGCRATPGGAAPEEGAQRCRKRDRAEVPEGNTLGGREAIASTNFGNAANPMFKPEPDCWMYKQGSFMTGFFQESAGVEERMRGLLATRNRFVI